MLFVTGEVAYVLVPPLWAFTFHFPFNLPFLFPFNFHRSACLKCKQYLFTLVCFHLPFPFQLSSKYMSLKPATDDLQNNHKHVSLLSFCNLYYFLVQLLAKWFHLLPREKIPLCFAKLPFILRNKTKHTTQETSTRASCLAYFCVKNVFYGSSCELSVARCMPQRKQYLSTRLSFCLPLITLSQFQWGMCHFCYPLRHYKFFWST